jgi:hypothetical protein
MKQLVRYSRRKFTTRTTFYQLFLFSQETTEVMTSIAHSKQLDCVKPEAVCESICPEAALELLPPGTFELLTHLRLIDAIICLKNAVDEDGEINGMKLDEDWDLFCRAAAVRFLDWSKNVNVSDTTIVLTPPLDVLMIWHSYMLNTKDYVAFQSEAFGDRIAGRGIDWQYLVRQLPSHVP